MLFHKKLNITAESVKIESNIDVLKNWRNTIANEIINIKRKQQDMHDESLLRRANDAKLYRAQLLNLIESQLKVLKIKGSKDVLLMRKFMKAAKEELSKETYNKILERAKILSGYNK